ncbi:MAG: pseudouridine synthase [Candidatus Zixiibacteriota bacterium]
MIRLNKYLSICGVTSRRGADSLIAEGRVSVNGAVVDKVGTIIDEAVDEVTVDGTSVNPVEELIYVVLNKPPNVMTTLADPFGRKTIVHFLEDLGARVYPVGRLDFDTEGVLLLTNDGDLAYRLAHPRYQVPKMYDVKVQGEFTESDAARIAGGIELEDGAVGRGQVKLVSHTGRISRIRIVLTEGRKREVKQLCKAVGHPVVKLRRTDFAGITVRGLKLGKWRKLTSEEISHLKKLVGLTG